MAGHGVLEDLLKASRQLAQLRALLRGARCAPARFLRCVTRDRDARFARDDHLLERQHRRAQGRDAHRTATCSPTSTRIAQLFWIDDERPHHRRAAVLPLVRLHRSRSGSRCSPAAAWSITRIRWTPRPSASWPRSTGRRCSSARRRSAPPTCASARKEQFAHLRYALVGAEKLREPIADARSGRSSASSCSRATAAPRWRRSSRSTCPTSTRAATRRSATSRARSAIRCRASRRAIVDPDDGEAAAAGQEGLLLVKGPNRMLGYLDAAGAHGRGHPRRLVRHRRHRADRRRRASSASPTGCRASARSAARWCRT